MYYIIYVNDNILYFINVKYIFFNDVLEFSLLMILFAFISSISFSYFIAIISRTVLKRNGKSRHLCLFLMSGARCSLFSCNVYHLSSGMNVCTVDLLLWTGRMKSYRINTVQISVGSIFIWRFVLK